jgi:hypothetical protein
MDSVLGKSEIGGLALGGVAARALSREPDLSSEAMHATWAKQQPRKRRRARPGGLRPRVRLNLLSDD